MTAKIIITDVDGVLTDWVTGFRQWMADQGRDAVDNYVDYYNIHEWYGITYNEAMKIIGIYNASEAIGTLPAYLDSVQYVKQLHYQHGYIFHAISSLGSSKYAHSLREQNLKNLFGETVFESFEFLETNENKKPALQKYEGTGYYWLEDKPANAVAGHHLGLKSILIGHKHNSNHDIPKDVIRVENWKSIYQIITDE